MATTPSRIAGKTGQQVHLSVNTQKQGAPAATKKTFALPDMDREKKGLSLRSLIRTTPPYVKMKARDVVVRRFTPRTTKGGHPAVVAACSKVGGTVHKLTIIGRDKLPAKLAGQKRVLVSCDCEDFMYTWEYALWTWGAADIKYCNGAPAVMKNPGNYPSLCCHLTAVAKLVIEQNA